MCAQYQRWTCLPSDLVDLTPRRARDLVVECFFQAQHEMMERGQVAMGLDVDPVAIRMGAESAVRMAFASTGGDFENPDKAGLERAVKSLTEMAGTFGTPADIIDHHEQQIAVLLAGLRR
jgi:hypothetical protein